MTESEWMDCDEPAPMLEHLGEAAGDRKLQLFAVACYRNVWHVVDDQLIRRAIEAMERFADDRATEEDVEAVRKALQSRHMVFFGSQVRVALLSAEKCVQAARISAWEPILLPQSGSESGSQSQRDEFERAALAARLVEARELRTQAALLRDIFGNPFRPRNFSPTWLTPAVVAVAQSIYENRAFDRLPILGKALRDVGCADDVILSHCRSETCHVRGCWVVDALGGWLPKGEQTGTLLDFGAISTI